MTGNWKSSSTCSYSPRRSTKQVGAIPTLILWLVETNSVFFAVNHVAMDDQRSTSLLKAVACGVLAPGVSVLKKLCLANTGAPGERVIDISVQSHSTAQPPTSPVSPTTPASATAPSLVDRSETLRTLAVPTVLPVEVEHTVTYRRPTKPQPGLADLMTFEGSHKDEAVAVEAIVTSIVSVVATSGLVVESVVLHRKVRAPLKLMLPHPERRRRTLRSSR